MTIRAPLNDHGTCLTMVHADLRSIFFLALAALTISSPAAGAEIHVLSNDVVFVNLTTISDDGSTVVGTVYVNDGPSNPEAVYWSESEGITVIGPGYAHNCSADGSVIVGNISGAGFRHIKGGPTTLLTPPVPNLSFAGAYDINSDGSVVVGNYGFESGPDNVVCAYRWDEVVGFQNLVCITNVGWCNATGVDATGSIICGFSGDEAFRWTVEFGYQQIPLVESQVLPWYMSNNGKHIIGTFGSDGSGVFRWSSSDGIVVLLQEGRGETGTQVSLSPDGDIAAERGPNESAKLWDEHNIVRSIRDVLVLEHDLPFWDWTDLYIQCVSSDRTRVVGLGRDPAGTLHSWVADLDHPLGTTRLRITSNPELGLRWLGATGETYVIERSQDLEFPLEWTPLSTIPGEEGIMTWSDEVQEDMLGVYRLVKSPGP